MPLRTAALAVLVAPSLAAAQAQVAVRGTVTTAAGRAPLQSARVAIETPGRVAVTNAAGEYVLRDLPTGRYALLVTALGYAPVRRAVDVVRGRATTVDVALETGSLLLSSVVTTATRTPVEANRVATTVNVLGAEQIRTTPARETQDLLREIPGVELPRTSSLVGGTAQIVSIRGVDEGRTAVLLDGIPVNDAWGEWIDWGRVPKHMLDRVEVIEGGTSIAAGVLHRQMEAGPDESLAADVAVLEDRQRVRAGRKQLYATQLRADGGRLAPYPTEDLEHVDLRRDAAGLPPLALSLCLARTAGACGAAR